MLISEAFELYCLDCIVAANQSAKTEENHYIAMRSLTRYFGDIDISLLTRQMVRDWKIFEDRSKSSNTVRNYVLKLRVVLRHLRDEGYEVLKPESVPIPKRADRVPEFLTAAQVQKVIDSTKRVKNKAIIALMYASGIRVSELCALNIADLKDDSFTIIGKGGVARLCFYDYRAKVLIEAYLKTREDNEPALFLTDSGIRIRPGSVQETFKSVRKISGLQIHPHTLRHSYATNLMKNGMHIYSVSRLLGHKSIQTTAIYLHVTDHHLKEEYAKYHTLS